MGEMSGPHVQCTCGLVWALRGTKWREQPCSTCATLRAENEQQGKDLIAQSRRLTETMEDMEKLNGDLYQARTAARAFVEWQEALRLYPMMRKDHEAKLEHVDKLLREVAGEATAPDTGRVGILPMFIDDGSSIVCDSISGGADSTGGEPNGLVLCLTNAGGGAKRVSYERIGRVDVPTEETPT